ncbi:hypothetical protein Ntsu_16970 [Nocardia sp. IFM 10818]
MVTNCSGALMRTGTDGPLLLIAQIHVLGYSDEPDPVAASDTGHPGLDDPAYPRHPVK